MLTLSLNLCRLLNSVQEIRNTNTWAKIENGNFIAGGEFGKSGENVSKKVILPKVSELPSWGHAHLAPSLATGLNAV